MIFLPGTACVSRQSSSPTGAESAGRCTARHIKGLILGGRTMRWQRTWARRRLEVERLEDRTLPAPANGYLLAFTAALKVNGNGVDLGGIFVMRPDGSGLRQITSFQTLDFNYELHGLNLPDDQPSFSPDGKKIVFTSNRDAGPRIGLSDEGFEIYSMNVNGTNITRLTNSPG